MEDQCEWCAEYADSGMHDSCEACGLCVCLDHSYWDDGDNTLCEQCFAEEIEEARLEGLEKERG